MPSGKAHHRLTYANAVEAHEVALETGGRPGVISEASIRSAIGRPYTGYYRPIYKKAAVLVQSMCLNHGFADGNKRTCFLLLNVLLERSGYTLKPHGREDVGRALEDLLSEVSEGAQRQSGPLILDDIETWMRQRIKKKPPRRR